MTDPEPLPALAAEPLNTPPTPPEAFMPPFDPAPHSVPATADHRSMVEALAIAAANLGWHAVGAKQSRYEITFICRPDRP